MIRHISVFTFLDTPADGSTKDANIEALRSYLDDLPARCPLIRRQAVHVGLGGAPALPEDAPLLFGELIQIADFATPEDAAAYPASRAHRELTEFSAQMLRKVTAIDFALSDPAL